MSKKFNHVIEVAHKIMLGYIGATAYREEKERGLFCLTVNPIMYDEKTYRARSLEKLYEKIMLDFDKNMRWKAGKEPKNYFTWPTPLKIK